MPCWPRPKKSVRLKSVARSRSGNGKDLKRILEASIEKDPDDEDANEILSSLYIALGDFETLKVFTEKLIERGKATFND